ncbi:MAG: VWA domain-containing protein [Acidobacteriaceae bacterium]|jgi:VWFA-related protein
MQLGKLALVSSFLLIALSTSIPAATQAAQDTTTPGAPAPASVDVPDTPIQTLHVTAREVVVDVMVTDAQGNPVHGLQQSSFTIQENGHPQIIDSFQEISSAIPVAEPPAPVLPRGVYTNSQSTPAAGPVDIFLLDALHCNPVTMIHALQAAGGYFASMPRGNKAALFWLSESGLHMMQGFTSDPATLTRALRSTNFTVGSDQERHTTDWYTIDALNQIAAYVAGIKGRKNLLWITPGMPVDLMRDGGYGWPHGNQPPDMGMVHRLMDIYERFTAEQVAVSPIDPRGVVGLGLASLKVEAVAEQTGGEAFYNTNDLKTAIAKAIDDQSHFYTISYVPRNQKDDAHYHTIKVQLDQPKLHLVYREGYNAERVPTADAPAPGPELLKASMQGNTPARTQILFDVGVWPTPSSDPSKKPPKSKTVRYEVHFGFPSSQIAFLEDPDGTLNGSLQFEIAAYNTDRKLVAHLSQTVKLPLFAADYDNFLAKPYHLNQQIDLPPGQLSLHVGILDGVSSKVGTLEIPVNVPR